MKIVYFYQYFSTPKGAWGTRVYEFTKNWADKGHKVTVVTSIYSKSDLKANKLIEYKTIDGIDVIVINVTIDNRQSTLKRLWTWFIYMFFSCWFAIKLPADIVIASSGPITVGIPGLVSKYIKRCKFVFEVRDIWPQAPIEMGLLKNKRLQKFLYWFEAKCYKASDYIITLSPGMKDNILSRYPELKVESVTNSANIELFSTPSQYDINFYSTIKYAVYTGNIGDVNNSEWLYNAAKILTQRNRCEIYILMVGDGQSRKRLEALAKEENVPNFICLGLMPKIELVAFVQHAMFSLVPLKGTPILDTSSPNKFFESLAAGIPVIQNTNGWMKTFLERNSVGFTIHPNDPEALADLLEDASDGKIDLKEMGNRAKKIAAEEFDKNILSQKMLDVLISIN